MGNISFNRNIEDEILNTNKEKIACELQCTDGKMYMATCLLTSSFDLESDELGSITVPFPMKTIKTVINYTLKKLFFEESSITHIEKVDICKFSRDELIEMIKALKYLKPTGQIIINLVEQIFNQQPFSCNGATYYAVDKLGYDPSIDPDQEILYMSDIPIKILQNYDEVLQIYNNIVQPIKEDLKNKSFKFTEFMVMHDGKTNAEPKLEYYSLDFQRLSIQYGTLIKYLVDKYQLTKDDKVEKIENAIRSEFNLEKKKLVLPPRPEGKYSMEESIKYYDLRNKMTEDHNNNESFECDMYISPIRMAITFWDFMHPQ